MGTENGNWLGRPQKGVRAMHKYLAKNPERFKGCEQLNTGFLKICLGPSYHLKANQRRRSFKNTVA